MKKYCLDCGQQFDIEPSQNYKTLCKPCFVESKKSELERLQNRLQRLEFENIRLRLQLGSGNRTTGGISSDLLKRLKQLCHPDKHQNNQLSTAVFSELNRF
jgi:predicted nuclease with TOPRIM domain